MTRVLNHLNNLNKVFDDNRHRPHVFGDWDCCILAADVALAVTGIDHFEVFRGQYQDLLTGLKLLRSNGEGTILKTVTKKLGLPIPIAHAWRGDIVYHRRNLGACAGQVALFITDNGLQPMPMARVEKVFGVR